MSKSSGHSSKLLPKTIYSYEILDYIGSGAGSTIYIASDPISGQIYALKHVIVENEKDVRFVEQLTNEFEVSSKVKHPQIRRCVDLKVTKPFMRNPTEAALIMELFDGVACDARPPETIAETVDVMRQTIDALRAMHMQGFIHCDLKPNNILVSAEGIVKLIDLGQACPVGTVKKRIQGTPDFIAPEQVRCEPVTVQTDVYNLGAAFYWMLTGKKLPTLFTIKRGSNSFLMPDAVAHPHAVNTQIPVGLSNMIMECVHVTPSRRPAGMSELHRKIEVIQQILPKHRSR